MVYFKRAEFWHRTPKTIVKPTALGPVANTDTKLLIYGLFQKGRVLAQDGVLALFTVGDVYASLCKRGAYAPISAQRRSRALFLL